VILSKQIVVEKKKRKIRSQSELHIYKYFFVLHFLSQHSIIYTIDYVNRAEILKRRSNKARPGGHVSNNACVGRWEKVDSVRIGRTRGIAASEGYR
jgi:hypothetical protein